MGEATEAAKHGAEHATDAAKVVIGTVKHAHIPSGDEVKSVMSKGRSKLSKSASAAAAEAADQAKDGAEVVGEKAKKGAGAAADKAKDLAGKGAAKAKEGAREGAAKVQGLGHKASGWLMGRTPIPNSLPYNFKWGVAGPRSVTSMWDSFQALVNEERSFWWTQQWFTAYLAWAIFVGVESKSSWLQSWTQKVLIIAGRNRDLPAVPFVLLSYCSSLAAAQALYFTLLLLQPPREKQQRRKKIWMPHPVLGVPVLLVLFLLPELPKAYQRLEIAKTTMWIPAPVFFSLLQSIVIVSPPLMTWMIRVGFRESMYTC